MSRPQVVLLGMMTKIPVPGVVWQTLQYLVGFERLGFETYYVEAHARTPSMFMIDDADPSERAAAFIDSTLGRFGLQDRWSFQALHSDGRSYGLDPSRLTKLYRSAAMIINLHAGTMPLEEHFATGRLVFLETDPVTTQVELHEDNQVTKEFLRCHSILFSYAESYGTPGCRLPRSNEFEFLPTRQPLLMDLWDHPRPDPGPAFTTVANWSQPWRTVTLEGEEYHWTKDREFMRFVDLPRLTGQEFELALSGHTDEARATLEAHGWRIRSALDLTPDSYRDYLAGSRAEFTVAKDQNVRLRTGWFSDRSAAYLASGRAVVTQETGFSHHLPTGTGLLPFSDGDELVDAIERVASDPPAHGRAAREIAREHFSHDVVLGRLLAAVDLSPVAGRRRRAEERGDGALADFTPPGAPPFPDDLVIDPARRSPTTLDAETVHRVLSRPVPAFHGSASGPFEPSISIVVPVHENLVFTRLCLESILAAPDAAQAEIIVVDDASADGTGAYLDQLASLDRRVRRLANDARAGFPATANRGLAHASAPRIVLLNNDTIPIAGWLGSLSGHLDDDRVGLVAPLTGRDGGPSTVPLSCRTYGELHEAATRLIATRQGSWRVANALNMFCVALRRDVYEEVGPLDEDFGVGLFEDDDYCARLSAEGYELRIAEDAFVHHFGRASFDGLVAGGGYQLLFEQNRRRYEEKWGRRWDRGPEPADPSYADLVGRVLHMIESQVPEGSSVAVVSRGDGALVSLGAVRHGIHFPSDHDGQYSGHYPADSAQAVALLEGVVERGAAYLVVPETSAWWLDHYAGLARHLELRAELVDRRAGTGAVYRVGRPSPIHGSRS